MARPGDRCGSCDGPVSVHNQTGFCTRTIECRKANRSVHDKAYDDRRRPKERGKVSKKVRRYPSHRWELFEDGIIDEVAIEIAVEGTRKVRLTPAEQMVCIQRLLRRQEGFAEIKIKLGVGNGKLTTILDEMGYEAIPDPAQAMGATRLLITRKDRPRRG